VELYPAIIMEEEEK